MRIRCPRFAFTTQQKHLDGRRRRTREFEFAAFRLKDAYVEWHEYMARDQEQGWYMYSNYVSRMASRAN